MTERTCAACGGKAQKEELLRWAAVNGMLVPDWTQKLDGRSVYTHFCRKCILGIYDSKKLFAAFGGKCTSFGIPKEEILGFAAKQARQSVVYYLSICRRSGVLLKGQNLIADEVKGGAVVAALIFASDASERTMADIEKKSGLKGKRSVLSKDEIGSMFDGRAVSVIALKPSAQSEKLMFYMDLLNNFISGDI